MPSFDVVCQLDLHELANAVDQSTREIATRFDFKGVDAQFIIKDNTVNLRAESEFQLNQMLDIFKKKLTKRNIDLSHMDIAEVKTSGKTAEQLITMKNGIDTEIAKKIVKFMKESKLKVQGSIQGEQVRVTGNKKDDLQTAIALLRQQSFGLPLQFTNFRD